MDDLTFTLRTLCLRNRDRSHATQADRLRALTLISRQLREDGFRQMRAISFKGKHVDTLIARWQAEGLSAGTLKNRVAHLRWWAEKAGKAGVIAADNAQLAIPDRQFVTNENKACQLGDSLNRVSDPCVRMSLQFQAAFGLRREECIKFQPRYADQGDHIVLKGSWTKGGRAPRRSDHNAGTARGVRPNASTRRCRVIDPASQNIHSATAYLRRAVQSGRLE